MAVKTGWRTFKNATWLGWQLDSNWTEPWLFFVYSVIKPIAGTLILVVMYTVVTRNTSNMDLFAYMYVGNAFFMFVAQVLFGVTWVIHDDREHYQTLKYIVISPASFYVYILGRSISKIAITALGVVITLAFGVIALGVPIDILLMNWPLLMVGMFLGLACIIALTARHAQGMNEGIAGLFYLFCGVIFPISALPEWSWWFAKILPVTYWLHVMRAAFFGDDSGVVGLDKALNFDVTQGLAILAVSTIAFLALSVGIFKLGDYIARKKGLIDMTTAY